MGSGKTFTKTEKEMLFKYKEEGKTMKEISSLLNRPIRSLQGVIHREKMREAQKRQQETPVIVKQPKLSDFTPREMIKYLYNLGYRIENNELVCYVKQTVNIKDIISNG